MPTREGKMSQYITTFKKSCVFCFLMLYILNAQEFGSRTNSYGARCYKYNNSAFCGSGYIGIGGYYTDFTGPTSTSYGGGAYLSLISKFYLEWLHIGLDSTIGIGGFVLNSPLNLSPQTQTDIGYFGSATISIGVNLDYLQLTIPTIAYVSFSADNYDVSINDSEHGFFTANLFLGFGAFSRLTLNERLHLELEVNMGFGFMRRYGGHGFYSILDGFNGSYRLEGIIGLMWRDYAILPKYKRRMPDFYTRIRSIYYYISSADLPYSGSILNTQTIQSPQSHNFRMMFEVGLGY